jgi:hypothetical protein
MRGIQAQDISNYFVSVCYSETQNRPTDSRLYNAFHEMAMCLFHDVSFSVSCKAAGSIIEGVL